MYLRNGMVHMPILISKDLWSNLQSGAGSSHERVQESIQQLQFLLRRIDSFIDSYLKDEVMVLKIVVYII